MTDKKVKSRELTGPGTRLILTSVAAGCFAVLLSLPRAVLPTSPPPLRFDAAAVDEASRAAREAASAEWDEGTPLWALYAEQGLAEIGEGESEEEFETRAAAIRREVTRVREVDEDVLRTFRAHLVNNLDVALRGERADEGEFLGTFPRMLERYGAMRDGERIAPDIVLRALFLARFNGIMGIELTEGLADVELQAYWGWLALGAADVPGERRVVGLRGYMDAGGLDGDEALGWFAYEAGDYASAVRYYARAGERGNYRLRNHALACQGLIE